MRLERFLVTKNGKPAAVIMNADQTIKTLLLTLSIA
jgi:PHD/YefM family antitoxin component YafN of YafNO toxin-antitoxin module